jgi:hypothetical protein
MAPPIFFVLPFCVTIAAAEWSIPASSDSTSHHSCDLQRLQMDDFISNDGFFSDKTFLDRLKSINAPVVIEGALSGWGTMMDKWSNQSYFLENFGSIVLPQNIVTTTSLDVAQGMRM